MLNQIYVQSVWPVKSCQMSIKVAQKIISLEKWNILTPLQKLPNNEGHLGYIIVATGFKKLPKVQQITQSEHTVYYVCSYDAPETCCLYISKSVFNIQRLGRSFEWQLKAK